MERTTKQILFIIIFIFSSPLIALSATYYVDASCGTSGNGTTATCGPNGPWKTLGEAASGVPNNANHTISVAAGTYTGMTDSRSGTSPGYRTWLANGIVTLTSTMNIYGSWVKVDGFTITHLNGPTDSCFNTTNTTTNGWFTNMRIHDCTYGGNIKGTGNLVDYWDMTDCSDYWHVFGSSHIFRHNYVHNHLQSDASFHSDVWQTYDVGSPDIAAQNVTIEYNHVFMGNDATRALTSEGTGSIHMMMWADSYSSTGRKNSGLVVRNNIFEGIGGSDLQNGHCDNCKFYNNFYRNDVRISRTNSGPGIGVYNADGLEIKNNMFIDGSQGVHVFSGVTNPHFASNLFWRSDGQSTRNYNYSSTGDIVNENPLFVSYDNGFYNSTDAYKLQSFSPAKDAGATVAVTDDFAGTSRPQGSAYDIGPYEFETAATPAAPSGLKVLSIQ